MRTAMIVIGTVMMMAGGLAVGAGMLHILAHVMDPIPPQDELWVWIALIGGGCVGFTGLVMLVVGYVTIDNKR